MTEEQLVLAIRLFCASSSPGSSSELVRGNRKIISFLPLDLKDTSGTSALDTLDLGLCWTLSFPPKATVTVGNTQVPAGWRGEREGSNA